jgi:leucyl aminopeptidase
MTIFSDISKQDMKETLTKLSSFTNRYYNSESGQEFSQWMLGQACKALGLQDGQPNALGATCTPFKHRKWDQPSIIVKIPGSSTNNDEKNELVILSSHMDSINQHSFGSDAVAPGADDDGDFLNVCNLINLLTSLLCL